LGIGDWGLGIGPIPNPQSPNLNIKLLKKLKKSTILIYNRKLKNNYLHMFIFTLINYINNTCLKIVIIKKGDI